MNYIYVDTGAMYRAMAVYFTQNHVNPDDEREINAAVSNVDITIEYMDGVQQVILTVTMSQDCYAQKKQEK